MLAMSGGFVSNIFLDWLFVQYMSLGLFGAALATGIGQAVTVVPCAVFLFLRIRKMGGGGILLFPSAYRQDRRGGRIALRADALPQYHHAHTQ